jgi:hypothetical protein
MTSQGRAIRYGLLVLAVGQIGGGLWALVAPRSFYGDFPGGGRHWVSALGPYNEHMTIDYGSLSLGLVIVMGAAAIALERRLVLVALVGWLGWALPHLIFHILNLGSYDTTDAVANVITLGLTVLVPLGLLPLAWRLPSAAVQPVAKPDRH